jgi:ABC-type glycerol-3-phosphate transport system substrate-binding protein
VPKGPANAGTVVQFDGIQMVNGSKHPEESWEWMNFLVSDQRAYTILMQATGRPPSVTKGLPSYLKIVQENGIPAHLNVLSDAVMNPSMAPCIPAVPNVTPIMSVFSTEVKKYINNQQSLPATLELMNENVDRLIKEATGNVTK